MKVISSLTEDQRLALEKVYRTGAVHRERQRAQAILLSAKGFTLGQLALACDVHPETVSAWLNAWQERGLSGLQDAPKSGRKPKIDAAIREYLHEMLQHPSPNMKAVALEEINSKMKKKASK